MSLRDIVVAKHAAAETVASFASKARSGKSLLLGGDDEGVAHARCTYGSTVEFGRPRALATY